jgi:N-methylhydantoinase A/oxoprolinase/acetone carboxylase beta subunit/N-methylhydantoinase B/oxoprolinase/acetone carboxylase alpha subunit
MTTRLRVGIDVGGTFTDLTATDVRTGEVVTIKTSTTPQAPERGAMAALDALMQRYNGALEIEFIAHSTTIATNALLGQVGLELPRVALVTTEGFRDVVEIGRQNRSELYDLMVQRPKPLVARDDRFTVEERIDQNGKVVRRPSDAAIAAICERLRAGGFDAVAVCFLNSYANDANERIVAKAVAGALGGAAITRSSDVDREYREYERFSTAVVNVALAHIVQRYLERFVAALREKHVAAPLYVMRSDGGLSQADRISATPASIIESGPASGVIAAAALARTRGVARVLSFDMGGTTAKAGTIVDGVVQVATEFEAAGRTHSGRAIKGSGYPVRFPFVDLAEVSAGGGTIAWIDDAGSLRAGPLSAGADPGPACYGKSSEATATDANVVLGRLNQTHLLGGTFPIDAARSRAAIGTLAQRLGLSVEATAAGIVTLVDAQMAKVLRIVTVERGLDPRDFTLVAYGGGGPLHACALAAELGLTQVLVPRHPGTFSAQGLLVADAGTSLVEPVLRELDKIQHAALEALFKKHEDAARTQLVEQGVAHDAIGFRREYDARYRGQSFELTIEHGDSLDAIARNFHAAHRARYGYSADDEPIELVNARTTARGSLLCHPERSERDTAERAQSKDSLTTRKVWIDGAFTEVPVYDRDALEDGARIEGPAIVEQYDTTTYVAPGWTCESSGDALVLSCPSTARLRRSAQDDKSTDNVTFEVIKSALVYASEEMGIAVRNSAYSPNIKERLDHSCALFDKKGRLIAQAEHIPVHLGSLPWGLHRLKAAIERDHGGMREGEMWVANDPYVTGTHLNDVTVVRPIFFNGTLAGYAANKAHHTDVGGSVPGSMPVDAAELFAEGLVVAPMRLIEGDQPVAGTIDLFRANSRTPDARAGDLRAQAAGNYTGERRLLELYERYGTETVERAIDAALRDSATRMRNALRALGAGVFTSEDFLEDPDGKPTVRIALKLELRRDGSVRFDYTGTSPQVPLPLNAVLGVTLSGVHYALRTVTDPTIPMNEGCFEPVDVFVPEGTLLNPHRPAAVSGGNVETSTRNADVVLEALAKAAPDRVPACSGGTMSNVMLGGTNGNETWAFYETNGCGMGARPAADGIDGIQCHMTNTLNTPIEAIERDYPLRIVRYEFASGTGGAGHFRGGDGLIRAIELAEGTAHASLLADRHTLAPPGTRGGKPGTPGRHTLVRDGVEKQIGGKVSFKLKPGDTIVVQTPGGGGYGEAN